MKSKLVLILSLIPSILTAGIGTPEKLPAGYIIPPFTISPDHKYGVSVFDNTTDDYPPGGVDANKVIELQSGRVVGEIHGNSAMMRMNHGGISGCYWSSDSSLLLWDVDGKWSPSALVLLRFKDGKLKSQIDILTLVQQEILKRTRKAAPDRYSTVKKDNAGHGSAYPDGFTVDVKVPGSVALPIQVEAVLTSDPKALEGAPLLESHLEGFIGEDGRLKVTNFGLGHIDWPRF